MLDPWRHLDDWNKSSNRDQPTFDGFYAFGLDWIYDASRPTRSSLRAIAWPRR
jgi:hypothetical protein